MLVNNKCPIYEHRPMTCRTYDCRVSPATALEVDDDKALIAQRARRWKFEYPSPDDTTEHKAIQAAATFLTSHRHLLPESTGPMDETQLAVLAIEIHEIFLEQDMETDQTRVVSPEPDAVRAEVIRRTRG
jgi:Fe-S-cluster containining protein